MFEVGAQQLSESLLRVQCGEPVSRMGNRSPHALIQGVYPTRGDDRWIAITIADARDWARLVELMGKGFPDADVLRRVDDATRDAMDDAIAHFTSSWIDVELMHMLQARGIAAGVLQDADDLMERDPQLRARGAFVTLEHPVLGAFAHLALPYRLDSAPAVMRTSPLLGQHTDHVCRKMLGLGDAQIAAWTEEGLLI
jgi:benzylsuccinate CoA-transferase BbsF subunit